VYRRARSQEAVDLDLADVDSTRTHVREGGKERVIPLGEASHRLAVYLREARRAGAGAENALFLSARGRRLDTSTAPPASPPHRRGTRSPRTF
jgi:site-specific recombinase XerD